MNVDGQTQLLPETRHCSCLVLVRLPELTFMNSCYIHAGIKHYKTQLQSVFFYVQKCTHLVTWTEKQTHAPGSWKWYIRFCKCIICWRIWRGIGLHCLHPHTCIIGSDKKPHCWTYAIISVLKSLSHLINLGPNPSRLNVLYTNFQDTESNGFSNSISISKSGILSFYV